MRRRVRGSGWKNTDNGTDRCHHNRYTFSHLYDWRATGQSDLVARITLGLLDHLHLLGCGGVSSGGGCPGQFVARHRTQGKSRRRDQGGFCSSLLQRRAGQVVQHRRNPFKRRHGQTHSIFRGSRGSDIAFQKKVMTDSFYMVLPSNASLQRFPDNRPGYYRIRLPEMMHLKGHWKVGLLNLIFPTTFTPRTWILWPPWYPWETLKRTLSTSSMRQTSKRWVISWMLP